MTEKEAMFILMLAKSRVCNDELTEALDMAIEALEQAPKTGYWIPVYQGDCIINYRCSECDYGDTLGKSYHGMNYCFKCGARMEVINNDERKSNHNFRQYTD